MGLLAEKQRNNRIAIKRILFRILSRTVFGHNEGRPGHILNFRHRLSLPPGDVVAVSSWKLTSGLVSMLTISMAHPNAAWSQTGRAQERHHLLRARLNVAAPRSQRTYVR